MKLKVEFFHDVICSFCYPMSYRMRMIEKEMDNVEIIHRSYALAPDAKTYEMQFGSRENVKDEIVNHWVYANENDDLHRFNIEGMKEKDFLFPTSMNPLKACKAAYLTSGDNAYWDVFDALQKGFFTDSKNIESEEVIFDIVKGCEVDFDTFKKHYEDKDTVLKIEEDFYLAYQYGIESVPALVMDGKYLMSGAQPYDVIKDSLNEIYQEKLNNIIKTNNELESKGEEGNSCDLVDGEWKCE